MFNTFKMSFWTLKASNTSQCIEKNYQLIAQIDFFFHKRKSNGLGITKMGKFRNVVYSYYSFKTHQTFSFSCMSSKNSSSHSLRSTRYSWIRPPNLYWTHTHTHTHFFQQNSTRFCQLQAWLGILGCFLRGWWEKLLHSAWKSARTNTLQTCWKTLQHNWHPREEQTGEACCGWACYVVSSGQFLHSHFRIRHEMWV